jgi:uncharacterized protein (TIGR03437 family)
LIISRPLLLFSFLLPLSLADAQTLNPKPVKALGAPRLLATQSNPGALDSVNPNYIEGKDLFNPTAVALDKSTNPPSVYVADTSNNRVLGWRYASQLANGAPADIVIGQKDFYSTLAQGPSGLTIGFNLPTGLAVDKTGNLYVADTGNNRILRFPQPFLQPDVLKTPDIVLGQSAFSLNAVNPTGVASTSLFFYGGQGFPPHIGLAFNAAGDLFTTDPGNNRVLRYSSSVLANGASGAAADLVLGQRTFTTNATDAQRISKTTITGPLGLAFDSVGRLFVADSLARVLVFGPTVNSGSAAARILGIPVQVEGQPAPAAVSATALGSVSSVSIGAGDRPVVVDTGNNRVLIYDSFDKFPPETATLFSPAAIAVIGQNGFGERSANQRLLIPNSSSLSAPFDAAASATELFVADTGNNRILVYPFAASGFTLTATRVLGQIGFSLFAPNFVEGREFNLSVGGNFGSIVIDRNSNPPHLYVADPGNNRVLGFADFNNAKGGDYADLVIGQQNLFTTNFNNLTNDPSLPTLFGLNRPTALALDAAGNLLVADSGNSRVLRFPQPFAQANRSSQNADLVIGQSNFTSVVSSATAKTMQTPSGIAVLSDGSLLVSDAALNRVLYFPIPLTSGMAATKVLGQTDFSSPNTGGASVFDPSRFVTPRQIAVDPQDRVYVADTGNRRVAIFDSIANLSSTLPSPALSLTASLNQPVGITIGAANTPNAGQIWVTDFGANVAFHYPPFTQLLQNGSPDLAVSAFHPVSAAFDSFGDLALADVADRILLFVPQLTVVNASSFAAGAVAPGTIVSVFPATALANSSPAVLSSQTANFTDSPSPLPLPTALGDVQVLVNGMAAPLFYVSPSQINLPLPSTLPTSGNVDLAIVSKSSARIYGLTEISLGVVSPGLFTYAGSGTGQLAALNGNDNSVNTASKPLVRGQVIVLFGTGQGTVPNGPADGTAAVGAISTADRPRAVIGGVDVPDANIEYSGLAPGLIGVWQINVRVPQEVTAGNQVSVVVFLRSVRSQLSTFIALR